MHPRFRLPGAVAAVALVLVCGPVAHRLLAHSFDKLQSAEIERFLAEAPIQLGETLGGVTRSRKAILQLNGETHFAVWKTIDEKRTGVTSLGRAGSDATAISPNRSAQGKVPVGTYKAADSACSTTSAAAAVSIR